MTAVVAAALPRAATPTSQQPQSSSGPELNAGINAAAAITGARRAGRSGLADPLSDRTTSTLIRRTLCPQSLGDKGRDSQQPTEELLPPLTSRNDVDLQLYAFLAIILRDFVQSWYSKITTDETFIAETIQIVAHCTTALEQRVRKLDLESLVLDEIPNLLDRHVTAYRTAHQPESHPPVETDPQEVYHALCPLPFLSPVPRPDDPASISEQQANEAAYRQLLVQAVLAVLLPTEDLENPCLTALVGQIFSELVIGNLVANKLAQPWLLLEIVCIVGTLLEEKKATPRGRVASSTRPSSDSGPSALKRRRWSAHALLLWLIHLVVMLASMARFAFNILAMSTSLPPRVSFVDQEPGSSHNQRLEADHSPKRPVLEFTIWPFVANLVEMPLRMPWLYGFLSLLQFGAINGPWRVAALNGAFDRLLSHHIQAVYFSPSRLAPLLRSVRGVLFPNNAPGTPTLFPPPSEDELRALRTRAAKALWGAVPSGVGRLYFGGRLWRRSGDDAVEDKEMVEELEGLLMVFSDEYCNKHLMYSVLELVLVRLMPELSKKGIEELWDERLG